MIELHKEKFLLLLLGRKLLTFLDEFWLFFICHCHCDVMSIMYVEL